MRIVIAIILTALVTSGWWYFGINGFPEKGAPVLFVILTGFGTLADIFIFGAAVFDDWC